MKKTILLLSILLLNTSSKSTMYCDIKGNINNPGVYEIKENYTIQNVINAAGGLKKDSYTKNINLSKKVTDEMVIYIFNNDEVSKIEELNNCLCEPIYKYIECSEPNGESTTTAITTTNFTEPTTKLITTEVPTTKKITTDEVPSTTKIKENKININLCTKEDLLSIKGLGEIKAEAIISYRNTNGLFESIEEITKVSGIGTATFEKIKEFITI